MTRGRVAFLKAEHERSRMVAWEQARWLAFAFHDPKNMPSYEAVEARKASPADDPMQAVNDAKVRGWFIAQSMRTH